MAKVIKNGFAEGGVEFELYSLESCLYQLKTRTNKDPDILK